MKLPANIRAQIQRTVAANIAPPTAALVRTTPQSTALAEAVANPLLTREDRLRWLRDFAVGTMRFEKYQRGMITQVAADAPLRLRAVEIIARIEGDLKMDPFAGATIDKMVLVLPANGRTREAAIDTEGEDV